MFREWGYLISEMVLLIILAALLGLIVGWIVWGRRKGDEAAMTKLKADLDLCQSQSAEKDKIIVDLEAEAAEAEALVEVEREVAAEAAAEAVAVAEAVEADHGKHPVHPDATGDTVAKDYDGDGSVEGKAEGAKPATLTAARGGKADDLKQIKGIGPKLEALCNRLGFFHFDQIAAWTSEEVAWVDANLEGFKGRVSRDNWVDQAKVLAAGGTTEFAKKVKKGGVYD